MKLSIITWLWSQPNCRTAYKAEHVNIWADMIRRHCSLDIRLACVTDMPKGIDASIEIITPPGEFVGLETRRWKNEKPNCYRRLAMFRPDAAELFGERFVSMDLDCVIGDSLDPLFDRDDDFVICAASTEGDRWRYNGSMMLMTAGCRSKVYQEFTPEGAEEASLKFVGSDQAWIGHILGTGETTWGAADGVARWGGAKATFPKVMFFPGALKPWDVVRHGDNKWVCEHYRRDERGRGLYLGYGKSVWDDAAAAVAQPHVGVIASPEAARHWPGEIAVTARDDDQARRFARMLGFDELVHCGEAA